MFAQKRLEAKMSTGGIVALAVVLALVVAGVVLFCVFMPLGQYFKAKYSGAPISLKKLLQIKSSKERIDEIVGLYIAAKNANILLSVDDILNHRNAGGSVDAVIRAMQMANEAGINLPISLAKSLDLAGKNVVELVKYCFNPKIVSTNQIVGIAQDGVEVKLRMDITLRTNIRRALSGSSEDTIISRVSEACISAIGSASSHNVVVENPDVITDSILQKDLDSDSIYEIVSIDCSACEIGENVKGRLAAEKAEQDKRIRIAESEVEREKLITKEQEAKIKVQEAKAEAARQEAEVPKALVAALNEGKLSTMDYLTIENLKSDTNMRNAISQNNIKPDDDFDDFDF